MDWKKGFSQEEAGRRLAIYGRNEIKIKVAIIWPRILLNQIKSPLVFVLVAASLVSFFLGEVIDAAVILVAVVINTVFGFFQEYRAEKSMAALANLLTPKARVRRGNTWQETEAALLVPGDVVKLTVGAKIPADGFLIVEDGMFVNEAILTGESMPVAKKTWPMSDFSIESDYFEKVSDEHKCYMSTVIDRGIGEMLVVRTGMKTRMGSIARSVQERQGAVTPLQQRLAKLTEQLMIVILVMAAAIFVYGIVKGEPLVQFLNTSVALAVAAIPEGLLVGLTVILAVGMNRILKRKSIVRGLIAAETLGSVSTICMDKTGTITLGKMEVVGAVTDLTNIDEQIKSENDHDKEKLKKLILASWLCNDERDPLEIAMRNWSALRLEKRLGKAEAEKYVRTDELPFEHKYKYIVTRHEINNTPSPRSSGVSPPNLGGEDNEKTFVEFLSGAPEVVLDKIKVDEETKNKWKQAFVDLGIKGYRMVATGMKVVGGDVAEQKIVREQIGDYDWLGVVLFSDPVREGVADSLARATGAGIKLKVITGDYKETAWAVMRQSGLVESYEVDDSLVMMGTDFTSLAGAAKKEKIIKAVLFARTSPEQKLEIVETLQAAGETIAMMGDGVNDVPALKRADIGIVVSEASDLAREVADLILLDNNFATILAAVEEGRGIFDNLQKVILYLLSDSFAAIIVVVVSIFFGWPLPLLTSQILWINLISDGFPYMALTVEPKEEGLLTRTPLAKKASILDHKRVALIGVISLTAAVITTIAFGLSYFVWGKGIEYSRTMAFAMQGFSSLVYVFSSRSLNKPIWEDNFFKNPLLILGVGGGLLMQLAAIYVPVMQIIFQTIALSVADWWILLTGGLVLIAVIEVTKHVFFRNGV